MPQPKLAHSQAAAKYRAPRKAAAAAPPPLTDSEPETPPKKAGKGKSDSTVLHNCTIDSNSLILTAAAKGAVSSAKKVAKPPARNTVAQQAAVCRAKAKAELQKKLQAPAVFDEAKPEVQVDGGSATEEESKSDSADEGGSEGTMIPIWSTLSSLRYVQQRRCALMPLTSRTNFGTIEHVHQRRTQVRTPSLSLSLRGFQSDNRRIALENRMKPP